MLRIAICDDHEDESLLVRQYTERFFSKKTTDIEMDVYPSMTALLETGNAYDLYLLDVLMPGMTGIEGARHLNTRDNQPLIIFITSSMDAAIEGYGVNAAGFLLKPLAYDKYCETMERVFDRYLFPEEKTITITYNRVPVSIPLSQIMYLENKLHSVSIFLSDGRIFTESSKLSSYADKLTIDDSFVRCHQSYIVNMKYVKDIDEAGFVLYNGTYVPISRSRYKQCKMDFYHFRLD
ncbi:MAG: response regulator transcription factor [Lachnospiraceae bacterium]|nr:response regulator transcription factor [Candidatus Equihabitans merdae]